MWKIIWTDYLRYRAELRGFDLAKPEQILLYSSERYFDTETRRLVVVGRHDEQLVVIPCDMNGEDNMIIPVTVHTITRQQIRFRLRAGRFTHE